MKKNLKNMYEAYSKILEELEELEEQNKQLKLQVEELNASLYQSNMELYYMKNLKQQLAEMQNEKNELISKYRYWRGECCELNQQLHDLPKKIVSEIKIEMGSIEDILINCGNGKEDALSWFNKILQTILKNYGVNKNE